ncbi:hypothetical protein VTJ83DRAFT_6916 [Remersonia thermophila]|uniref:RBR-type E3 ubiquitin transferase n=1 Tax=Remersonia thermophila TaxID=72144 RepID=A0ABR4D666_9PEZI
MSSISLPTAVPFYGSVSPSLLRDFDDDDDDDDPLFAPAARSANTQKQQKKQQQQPRAADPRDSDTFLEYRYIFSYNPSLLDVGLEDEDQHRRPSNLITMDELRRLRDPLFEDEDEESEPSNRPTPPGNPPPEEDPAQRTPGTSVEDEPARPPTATPKKPPMEPVAPQHDPFAHSIPRRARSKPRNPRSDNAASLRAQAGSTTTTTIVAEPLLSNNPYAALIEEKQKALTVAFLSSPDLPSELDGTPTIQPDDLGFGQRYHVAQETSTVVITNQRKVTDLLTGDRDCVICTYTKAVTEFPAVAVTKDCTHEINSCLECIARCIRSELESRLWNDIRCPECRAKLDPVDVQRLADAETNERYQTLAFRAALSAAPNFIWCTAGCGMGQVHEGGAEQPIVTCLQCGQRSCFHHKVAWHQTMKCDEYDAFLADPDNFRSWFDTANEEAERAVRAQIEADRALAQSLLEEEQRAEAERVAALERAAREEREKREREERETQQKHLKELAKRKKKEEEASEKTVKKTTKPCPGCKAPIEKNNGCQHMTCSKCKHEFCWDCMADYKMIRQYDNSKHDAKCPWYPDNILD